MLMFDSTDTEVKGQTHPPPQLPLDLRGIILGLFLYCIINTLNDNGSVNDMLVQITI